MVSWATEAGSCNVRSAVATVSPSRNTVDAPLRRAGIWLGRQIKATDMRCRGRTRVRLQRDVADVVQVGFEVVVEVIAFASRDRQEDDGRAWFREVAHRVGGGPIVLIFVGVRQLNGRRAQ